MRRQASPPRLAALADAPKLCIGRDEPDPRGWAVITRDGQRAGIVAELIVDPQALKVRYLECRFEDRHSVLIPIVFVRLDAAARLVILDVLGATELRALAARTRLPTSAEEEAELHAAFVAQATDPDA
jgi:photosynthetic reaction center H subunit